jgi:hypothetical protein
MWPLLLGVALLLVVLLGARAFVQANPAQLAKGLRIFTAALATLAGTGLLVSGRLGLAMMVGGALLMTWRAMRRMQPGNSGGADAAGRGPGSSEVVTDSLVMRLDHATGALEGEVRQGPLAGRALASLGLPDLLRLLQACERDDPRAVPLLETYLDRRRPGWREEMAGNGGEARPAPPRPPGGRMDLATARSILGLDASADEAAIKAAHRRLMAKLHPDHGGSDYLAAQLNEAKETLLRGGR